MQTNAFWPPSRRLVNFAGFGACALALGYAYFMQYYMGLEPCNLCIFQRLAIVKLGIVFLLAALHNPGGWGRWVYSGLLGLIALGGAALAGRQLWLQNLPADQVPACGPGLDYMLEVFSITETIGMVLQGSGDCAEVQWVFLGLSIPGWTLVLFVIFGTAGVVRNALRP